jgi:hypothetical protein
LYPNGSKEDAKNYISIFLSCLNILQEVTINFTVMFVSKAKGSSTDKVLGMRFIVLFTHSHHTQEKKREKRETLLVVKPY